MRTAIALVGWVGMMLSSAAWAALPPAPEEMAGWEMPWGGQVPGQMAAAGIIDRPAGRDGPVVVRDGHFYSGSKRVRFWGVNIAFSGNLPTHAQADDVARRLARFGINAVRIHHADMFPYPNGLFADDSLEKLSPQALDRLDYFVAALKARGIYSDLNLHVSRWWSKAHHWENADKTPDFDKIIDLFDPRLIAADKEYARDLLTHVNAYTHNRYADEPAVCFVEINNENSMFYWGGERKIAELPEPYGSELTGLWNQWLAKKYGSRQRLKAAWDKGTQPARGDSLLMDSHLSTLGRPNARWSVEEHEGARMSATAGASDGTNAVIRVAESDGVNWHLQVCAPGLHLRKGVYYTLTFAASADEPTKLGVGVSQAHQPWTSLGLSEAIHVGPKRQYRTGFVASADDDDARVCFQLGAKADTIRLGAVTLREGGQEGLADGEDPARRNVARGYPDQGFSAARLADWYQFVQQTDESYFVNVRRFLKEDLGVKCPVTGTIGLGPLGTLSQSKMDFLDAHAYWDHPQFPGGNWSDTNWKEKNQPMVDDPSGATLWGLAATRVSGMPFTVTEYNHAAPNEWQAECVPMIATYAALQDWDGVFLFAYSHDNRYRAKDHAVSFFDYEGNPQKMDLLPMGARIFLGGAVRPLAGERIVRVPHELMMRTASQYYWDVWPFVRDALRVTTNEALGSRTYLSFDGKAAEQPSALDPRIRWTGSGPDTGAGRFELRDPNASVFVGFSAGPMPVDLGGMTLDKLGSPFATLMLVSQRPGEPIASAKRLLLSAVARGGNTGMQWDASRHTVGNRWGTAPPLVEVVHATISIRGDRPLTAYALTPAGTRGAKLPCRYENGRTIVELGSEKTIWYELERE